ncbi:MAG: PqqD family protein [Faecousia sp.]
MQLKEQFILRQIMDEYVLIPTGETAGWMRGLVGLNEVSARIWELLPEVSGEEELVSRLLSEYEVEESRLRSDVKDFLQMLRKRGLLDDA